MFGKRSVSGAEVGSAPAAPALLTPAPMPAPTPSEPDPNGRTAFPSAGLAAPLVPAPVPQSGRVVGANHNPTPPVSANDARKSDGYYETKGAVFGALIEKLRAK